MDHTKRHASIGLGTEMGYDRLMETVAFFFGSTRIHKLAIGNSRKWWGDANWRPYPLTSLMAGDKVIFYQHNLPVQTMVINRENFIWNCAFGFSLSYLYSNDPDGNDDWLDVASQFQAHAVSRYAGERMISYDETMPGATRSVFPSATITANWDEDLPLSAGAHSISPEGCLISSTDGAMTAGIFESFHSATLTAGGHFLILERSEDDSIRVWQPRGGDTNIRVRIAAVEEAQSLRCFAVAEDGRFEVPMEVEGEYGTFEWKRYREGERVIQYVIGGRNPSGMQAPPSGAPAEYALEQNYPNPFNPATRVRFSLARSGRILLTVYTIRGEEVETLVSEWKEAGHHEVVWDAGDLPGGIYLYRLRTGAYTETRKLILQK